MFWIEATEALIENDAAVHAGLCTRLSGDDMEDYEEDAQ